VAQVRSERFALLHAIEQVDDQVAELHERTAKWDQSKATLVLAQSELNRAKKLSVSNAVSIEDVEEKQAALDVAKAQTNQALQDVYEARASLGLPGAVADGASLDDVPPDLDQNFSSVRVALADLIHGAAQLGVVHSSYNLTPKETLDEFYKRDPDGNIDRIFDAIIKEAPTLKQAQAAVGKAQRDLDQANLNLRYCKIVSEIDGVVTRRNVNPGNNVLVGQSLMAVRSLNDIWIDANFKETQLSNLRIGQHVDLETDLYGRHRTFEGRISGFTMGTGSTLALLPAQNATGNFVKVVQRLPVRIDVLNYDPDKLPLFVGLSVTPTVDLEAEPTGPNAGKFLQEALPNSSATDTAAGTPQP
jgi:membrane fusion protein (multidrug efflux system)